MAIIFGFRKQCGRNPISSVLNLHLPSPCTNFANGIMIVCITEKPSVAADIAKILGAAHRHDGFYEGNGYCVTWTFGHLCELKEPHDYATQWRRWNLWDLPMIPPRFGIKLKADKGIEKQFAVIEKLIGQADSVINCGDAGQEGELIQRWVMQKAACDKPVRRLWISSLTDESIRNGFAALRPQSELDTLYFAGLSRAIGDWLLGMNATRLYTMKYANNSGVLSIGRVQTPTLAMIVARQREIENFVPKDFWELKTVYRDTTFSAVKGRYEDEAKAQAALQAITGQPFTVTSVETKKGTEAPPRLFDLTSLQVECNSRYSFSADETLRLIQSLYEKKVTTYPRVDTTFLPDDVYPKIAPTLRDLAPYANLTAPLLAAPIRKRKRVFDNSKVTDHHAIIPTGMPPERAGLSLDEKRVFDLVAKRFIAAFYPDCEFLQTTVLGEAAAVQFKAIGKVITLNGWHDVIPLKSDKSEKGDDSDKSDSQVLPEFVKGESGPHEPLLKKGATTPPKLYTEGTLLRAMETAGKTVDDEELRDAMKENGIGRPSTRAGIIETLLRRHYIAKQRKSLTATPAGIALIDTIKEPLLKSAALTGQWERKLRLIERGEYQAADFIAELKQMVTDVVTTVRADNSGAAIVVAPTSGAKPTKSRKAATPRRPKK